MLFFYNRVLLIAVTALALLQLTVARPLPLIEDNALVERRASEASNNAHLESVKPPSSEWSTPKRQKSTAQDISFAPHAKHELRKMGLSKTQHDKMFEWHKDQIRHAINTNPHLKGAVKARITHVAHKGGKNPNEGNHIVAHIIGADGKYIFTAYNGRTTINHHIYVGTQGLTAMGKEAWAKNNDNVHKEK